MKTKIKKYTKQRKINILSIKYNYIHLWLESIVQFEKYACVPSPKKINNNSIKKNYGHLKRNYVYLKRNLLKYNIFNFNIRQNLYSFVHIPIKHYTILSTMYTIQCIQCIQLCSMVFVGGEQ